MLYLFVILLVSGDIDTINSLDFGGT
jgi:hypothetical protein